ncbi:hypothetical protein [Sorangium sp. So ce1099]|uniref:hypothetical protein n=1 Tax=Sorangium sp. So ce1099 TaxID=3133331 RepID=UPI003F5E908E
MDDDQSLAQVGIYTERRLDVSVKASVTHLTQNAAMTQIQIARAQVEIAHAKHLLPVRTMMRYLLAIVGVLLTFMLAIVLLSTWLKVETTLAVVIVLVAGATVATPVGIMLSKMTNRLLPADPEQSESSTETDGDGADKHGGRG